MCSMSRGPVKSYRCPVTNSKVDITQHISCQDIGVYILLCKKTSGECGQVCPIYIGECGDGLGSSFTHKLAGHLGSATNRSQADTVKPVGANFRLPGHRPERDLLMIPIEKIADPFVRKARESYYIQKFKSLKL